MADTSTVGNLLRVRNASGFVSDSQLADLLHGLASVVNAVAKDATTSMGHPNTNRAPAGQLRDAVFG
ncbi:hypothetical protein BCR34DRAFT_608793 [Clohesyomyces aquaticus]|uniref:Uncharacterized protein n=1 Tax=Clohesyomyces aquaticus TaxID=1231657 RepID=A0A1Y1Y4A1_9PLEO|nr:hypothetical protein BCR34DRAFT_608793 [Clohesyomyces aquaticus]